MDDKSFNETMDELLRVDVLEKVPAQAVVGALTVIARLLLDISRSLKAIADKETT